jgi:hypothetical protein
MASPTLQNLSALPTKRKVVLPEGLSGHHHIPHHDPWHQWEGLIVILVILHIGVLLFYTWILMEVSTDHEKLSSIQPSYASAHISACHATSGPHLKGASPTDDSDLSSDH